jgi:hypothetical protein
MLRFLTAAIGAAVISVSSSSLSAQSRPAAPPVIGACSLVSKAEVKTHLPWRPLLEQFPAEEEAMGTYGSGCEYPSVRVQVMTFSQGTVDNIRKKSGIETVSGIGDEAYFFNNANRYAELYVKVGARMLTLQANVNETVDGVKPGVMSLARVLVTKLR